MLKNHNILKLFISIVFLAFNLLPNETLAQKKQNTSKGNVIAKSTTNSVKSSENTGPSIEVEFMITKKEFYDLTKEIDISVLENKPPRTGVLLEYYGPQSEDCHQKLDYEAHLLLRDVRQKKDNLNYSLVVDWEACKIVSLEPYSKAINKYKSSYMVYHINLTPDSPLVKTKSKTIEKSNAPSGVKRPLLVTRLNNDGEWVATCPYGSSQPYTTEKEALAELFYDGPGAITFLGKRDIYNIYVINNKVDNVRLDVREFLTRLGVKDIPN